MLGVFNRLLVFRRFESRLEKVVSGQYPSLSSSFRDFLARLSSAQSLSHYEVSITFHSCSRPEDTQQMRVLAKVGKLGFIQ
jgi:hypothetical protein